ncbi:MAG: DUF3108 domain-containing protein [Deltaproteobacteria bacterium]|nr:DUF3108 domain-containing protein [Deltaproteobacteria bacterium]
MRWPLWFVVVVAASAGRAADDDLTPMRLTPLPIKPPIPRVVPAEPPAAAGACHDGGLPMLVERPTFGPGEALGFEMRVLGIRAGGLSLRIGEQTRVDDVAVFPVVARARTDRFLQALGDVDASMVSFIDPRSMRPVRMANHAVTRGPFEGGPSTVREDAAFAAGLLTPAGPSGGRVAAKFDLFANGKAVNKSGQSTSRADVVDILSIVYWLRSRQLEPGKRFCFEMFHRRRLWRLEGKVGVVKDTVSPFATRKARRLDLSVLRAEGKDPRPLTVWVSDDADRLPLLVSTSDNIDVRLTTFARGRAVVVAPAPVVAAPVVAPVVGPVPRVSAPVDAAAR